MEQTALAPVQNQQPNQNQQSEPIIAVDNTCRDFVKELHKKISDHSRSITKLQLDFEVMSKLYKELVENKKTVMMHSEQQDKLFEALSNAKGEIGEIERSGRSNRGAYANLDDMTDIARPVLKKYGLDIIQEPNKDNFLETTICHSSGQWRTSLAPIVFDEKPGAPYMQSYGGALTSLKRYVYGAILNLHTGG